jgi:hypothetical protein
MHATHFVISLPTRSLPRPSLRRPLAVAALLLLLCVIPAHAQTMAPPFLRVNDATLAAAVIRGAEQSPTFRALLERLAMSDLIVYLQRGRLLGNTAAFALSEDRLSHVRGVVALLRHQHGRQHRLPGTARTAQQLPAGDARRAGSSSDPSRRAGR